MEVDDPDLAALLALHHSGWTFRPITDDDGRLTGLTASRSRRAHTDALFVTETSVSAARVLDDPHGGGGCVWFHAGNDVREAVDDLLSLPNPGEPGAPTLVRHIPSLWTP